MNRRYSLADLLTLAVRVLAPFAGPLGWDVSGLPNVLKRPAADTPRESPTAAPPTPQEAATVPPEVLEQLPAAVPFVAVALAQQAAAEVLEQPAADLEAEPLFLKTGEGKGTRYRPAPPDATGDLFRRLVADGRRPKFVPVPRPGVAADPSTPTEEAKHGNRDGKPRAIPGGHAGRVRAGR